MFSRQSFGASAREHVRLSLSLCGGLGGCLIVFFWSIFLSVFGTSVIWLMQSFFFAVIGVSIFIIFRTVHMHESDSERSTSVVLAIFGFFLMLSLCFLWPCKSSYFVLC